MTALAWVVSLCASAFLGWEHRRLWEQVKEIRSMLLTKTDKKPVEEKKSTFIDNDDPLMVARYEFEEKMRELNE